MIKLGITGGIGSGKSYVSGLFRCKGISVYDTDVEAKRLMVSHAGIRKDLIALLGDQAYDGENLNKEFLIRYLFADSSNAEKINAIVHPRVKEDFLCWVNNHSAEDIVAMECAILFESGFADTVDYVCMVYAPLEVRIARAMQRDGVSRERVCERIAAQMSDEEKRLRADFVLINDGVQDIVAQTDSLICFFESGKAV